MGRAVPAWRVIVSTVAYWIPTAVACTVAGFALWKPAHWPSLDEFHQLASYSGLILPAFINYGALHEQALGGSQPRTFWRGDQGVLYPFLAFLIAVVVILWHCFGPDPWSNTACYAILLRAVPAVLPFYIMAIYRTVYWARRPEPFFFTFRSFFPALAGCLPSFLYGYLGFPTAGLWLVSATIVLLWVIALRGAVGYMAAGAICLLLAVTLGNFPTLLPFADPKHTIAVLSFGLYITLAMGVSEAIRFTTRVLADEEYRHVGGEFDADEKAFYLAWTNIAASVFFPAFLLTFLHPATSVGYLFTTGGILLTQYLLWISGVWRRRVAAWTSIGFIGGIALPFTVVAFASLDHPTEVYWSSKALWATWGSGALSVIAIVTLKSGVSRWWRQERRLARFQDGRAAFQLAVLVTATITFGLLMLAAELDGHDLDSSRLKLLDILLGPLALIGAFLATISRGRGPRTTRERV
jgi:hypothetical protein